MQRGLFHSRRVSSAHFETPGRGGAGVFALLAALLALASCRSASDYRREADETADAYLSAYQLEAVGRAEKIEIETPEDTLRRRLMIA